MRQGITTRYLGPTNSKGSRIKATARKGRSGYHVNGDDPHYVQSLKEMSHTQPYGYGNTEEEHTSAAKALAEKLGWSGLWVGGGNVNEDGYHYVYLGTIYGSALDVEPIYGTGGADWFYANKREEV